MHAEHAALLAELRAAAGPTTGGAHHSGSYTGSGGPSLNVTVPARRVIARRWLAAHRTLATADILAVVESLFAGTTHEEKTLGPLILAYHAAARRAVRPVDMDRWLGRVRGWAEVDTLCQNLIPAEDLLADWDAWRDLILALAKDGNIGKRRAALVLLTGPVRTSGDMRFRDLAFTVVDMLVSERDIMITKAVSWLLRSMTARHPVAVDHYVEDNLQTLPKIAIRETRTKLKTGVKSGHPQP